MSDSAEVPEITPTELNTRLEAGEVPVLVDCRSGSRSQWAVRLLLSRGYEKVLNLKGGVLAWREEVDPSLRAY